MNVFPGASIRNNQVTELKWFIIKRLANIVIARDPTFEPVSHKLITSNTNFIKVRYNSIIFRFYYSSLRKVKTNEQTLKH